MNSEQLTSALEALLFIYGDPIEIKKAASILEVKPADIEVAARQLGDMLKTSKRGVALVMYDSKLQLATAPDFSKLLERVMKAEMSEGLSPATVETLSIITYSAPVSRAEIDYIRGVNSTFILRALLLRGLIDRETDPARANAYIYKPSFEFLKFLGIASVNELPEFEKFSQLIKQLKTASTAPAPTEPAPPAEPTQS